MAKYIFSTDVIPQKLRFLADTFHRGELCTNVQAVTLFRVSKQMDGSGGVEWLLTRYHDVENNAYSSISRVEYGGKAEFMDELFYDVRKQEKTMIEDWKAFIEEEDDG